MAFFGLGKVKKASVEDEASFVEAAGITGDMERVKSLLASGVSADTKNTLGETSLRVAFKNFDIEMADMLLYAGACLTDDIIVEAYSAKSLLEGALPSCDRVRDAHARLGSASGEVSQSLYAEMVKFLVRKGASPEREYLGMSLERAIAARLSDSKTIREPALEADRLMKMVWGSGAVRAR